MRPSTIAALAVLALSAAAGVAQAAPAPCTQPSNRAWCDKALTPDKRAALLVRAMTQDEKITLLAGAPAGVHTGATAAIPRLGVPQSYMTDGPVGVRQGAATAMPAPIALAATFDPELAALYGATIGQEARAKGNLGLLAPTVNMMRTPMAGRVFEGFGEDPFLVARTTVRWIQGAQAQGVYATVKHYAANNQEGYDPSGLATQANLPLGLGKMGTRYLQDSVVDDRTLREIYLPQFEAAVKDAGVGAVMCSYNRVNGPWACASPVLLNSILKKEWGFKGMVMSDWIFATHIFGTNDHLGSGLDLEMPAADAYLPLLVKANLIAVPGTVAALDDHAQRILRTLFAFGFFDDPVDGPDDAAIERAAHRTASRRIAESAVTLLKNDGLLPLEAARRQSIAVVGTYADRFVTGGGSGSVSPFASVGVLQGLRDRVGSGANITYDDGSDAGRAASAAKAADVAVVVVGQYQTENSDRSCLTLECPDPELDQDALIDAVLAAQPNTIVVLETGGPVLTPWRDKAGAVVEAWFPGDQGGIALARVLFGDVDAAGRLPATFPKTAGQLQTAGDPEKYPGVAQTVQVQGRRAGRLSLVRRQAPRARLSVRLRSVLHQVRLRPDEGHRVQSGSTPRSDRVRPHPEHRQAAGLRRAAAVPGRAVGGRASSSRRASSPATQSSRSARAGSSARRSRSTSARCPIWDTGRSGWKVAPGCYRLMVGRSSRDIVREATVSVGQADCPGAVTRIA